MVHTVTFRGAMVIFNRTIYGKIHNKPFYELGDTPLGRWARNAPGPVIDRRTPRAPLNNLTQPHARKYTHTRHNNLQIHDRLRNSKIFSRARENPPPTAGVEPRQVRESSRAPRASPHKTPHKPPPMHKEITLQKL